MILFLLGILNALFIFLVLRYSNLLLQVPALYASIIISDFLKKYLYSYDKVLTISYYLILLMPDFVFLAILLSNKLFFNKKTFAFLLVFLNLYVFYSLPLNGLINVITNLKTTYYYLFILALSQISYSVTKDAFKSFYISLSILGVLASFYGIYQFFFGYPSWEINWLKNSPTSISLEGLTNKFEGLTNRGETFRAYSLFGGLHESALFFSYILSLISLTLSFKRDFISKQLLGFLFLSGVILSNAKGVYLGFFVAVVLYRCRWFLSPKKVFFIILLPVFILGFLPSDYIYKVGFFILEHLGSLAYYLNPGTLVPRLEIFSTFLGNINFDIYFFIGHGIGSLIRLEGVSTVLDNMYLQVLYEFGILGLIMLLFLIYKLYFYYFELIYSNNLGREEMILLNVSFLYITTLIIDLYVSADLVTRSNLILFAFSGKFIHCLYQKYNKAGMEPLL